MQMYIKNTGKYVYITNLDHIFRRNIQCHSGRVAYYRFMEIYKNEILHVLHIQLK